MKSFKFERGQSVKIINGEFSGITGIINQCIEDDKSYEVRLISDDSGRFVDVIEENLTYGSLEFNLNPIDETPKFDSIEWNASMFTAKNGFNSIKLAVWESEGPGYPHFHFYKNCKPEGGIPFSKRNGGGCICFESANYFKHGRHVDILNKTEIKGLINFLKSPYPGTDHTVWYQLLFGWNNENSESKELPLDLSIPEYYSSMPTIQNKRKE